MKLDLISWEFLRERKSKTDKKELQDIYYLEFKREGTREPHFSKLIYALEHFNKASIRHGKVILHAKPQVHVYYCDQWRSVSQPKSSCETDNGVPRAPDPDSASSCFTPPTLNPVLTPKRRLAKEILQMLRVNRADLISDKGGIEITSVPKSNNGEEKHCEQSHP